MAVRFPPRMSARRGVVEYNNPPSESPDYPVVVVIKYIAPSSVVARGDAVIGG